MQDDSHDLIGSNRTHYFRSNSKIQKAPANNYTELQSNHYTENVSNTDAAYNKGVQNAHPTHSRLLLHLICERQQCHKSGTLDRTHNLTLTFGAIATALTAEYLTAIGKQLLQHINIFVIDILSRFATEPTLSLLTRRTCKFAIFFA
jgi:hypothetical protein